MLSDEHLRRLDAVSAVEPGFTHRLIDRRERALSEAFIGEVVPVVLEEHGLPRADG